MSRIVRWLGRRRRARSTGLLGLSLFLAAPQLYAWHHFRAGRAALADDRPDVARRHFPKCGTVWPWGQRVDLHVLASRAARRDGDLPAALDELREGRRLAGTATPELIFEWALLQAADGNVAGVAVYLQRQADADPEIQRDVWEALAEGYLAVFRANDAYAIATQWTARFPEDPRGLEYRGRAAIQSRGRGLQLGVEDLRRVLERQPARTKTRTALAVSLLELGLFAEAIPEFERLAREQPDEPDHRVRLARCFKMSNRSDEATALLEGVLNSHPDHGLALRTSGQFALGDLRIAEAEAWLRRAAEVLPNDYQSQYLFYQALLQAGRSEAPGQLARAEQVKAQSLQLAELRSRRLAERPLDPALYTELGSLLLKTGKMDEGLRWLDVALSLDPAFRPAHASLADHFEAVGPPERAAVHRRLAVGR